MKTPIRTKQLTCEIDGIKTELLISSFHDSYFVLITQLRKFGTMISVQQVGAKRNVQGDGEFEENDEEDNNGEEVSFETEVLIGARSPPSTNLNSQHSLYEMIAVQVAKIISKTPTPPRTQSNYSFSYKNIGEKNELNGINHPSDNSRVGFADEEVHLGDEMKGVLLSISLKTDSKSSIKTILQVFQFLFSQP